MSKAIYNMKLFEYITIGDKYRNEEIMRVPGGWIHKQYQETPGKEYLVVTNTFIPYDTDFKVK